MSGWQIKAKNRLNGKKEDLYMIIEVGNVLVHSDIITEQFCCDLEACHGECCVEGDAGAPVTIDEIGEIEGCVDTVWSDLNASAQAIIDKQGVAYVDEEGDLVTSIVGGKDCVFTFYAPLNSIDTSSKCCDDCCFCALEKAYRAGKTPFCKPISCSLYPIREKQINAELTSISYNRWKVCAPAVKKGKELKLPLYKFLEGPLTKRFGKEWYQELCVVAEEYLKMEK